MGATMHRINAPNMKAMEKQVPHKRTCNHGDGLRIVQLAVKTALKA